MTEVAAGAPLDRAQLSELPKRQLIERVLQQQQALAEKDQAIAALTAQLAQLKSQHTDQGIARTVNQPTSKKPEWDKDGNLKRPGTKSRKRRVRIPSIVNAVSSAS